MTGHENDRLDVLEAKVDRILTLLDDPDFGIRPKLRALEGRARAVEMKVYGLLTGVLGSLVMVAVTFARGLGG